MTPATDIMALLPQHGNTYEDEQRIAHADIATLTPERLWAERELLRPALARVIYGNLRGLPIYGAPHTLMSAAEWMRERLRRLDAALAGRGRRAA
jgi:hypothetical protein